jgi:hypothetical protein
MEIWDAGSGGPSSGASGGRKALSKTEIVTGEDVAPQGTVQHAVSYGAGPRTGYHATFPHPGST